VLAQVMAKIRDNPVGVGKGEIAQVKAHSDNPVWRSCEEGRCGLGSPGHGSLRDNPVWRSCEEGTGGGG
jgi:hypothetical protein